MTLGNHEFDYGDARLIKNLERAQFKVICADVYQNQTGEPLFLIFSLKHLLKTHTYLKILLVLLLLLLSHFSCVRLCATPETAAHQAPPSLGFSRQEHWNGLPFASPVHESEK